MSLQGEASGRSRTERKWSSHWGDGNGDTEQAGNERLGKQLQMAMNLDFH